jgi:hypothetical protein
MIQELQRLTNEEKARIFKAPVYVSLLAASSNNEVSEKEKADAIKMAHLKTFTADPLLLEYYNEVEENFVDNFEAAVKRFTPFDDAKRELLTEEVNLLNKIIDKLDQPFASVLKKSLSGYAAHVKKSERALLSNFIFPFKLPGLTD